MFSNCAREDSWESFGLQGDQTSQSKRKSTLNIHWKDWYWNWSSNIWATWCKERLLGKDPNAGKDWRREEKGAAQDKMLGWRHRLSGHELELTPKDSGGQRSPEDCSPWGRKEWNTTWWPKSGRSSSLKHRNPGWVSRLLFWGFRFKTATSTLPWISSLLAHSTDFRSPDRWIDK